MRPHRSGKGVLGGHVDLHESLDLNSSVFVAENDFLRPTKLGFLCGIEVELDWGGRLEVGGNQHSEDFNEIDDTGTILTERNKVSMY